MTLRNTLDTHRWIVPVLRLVGLAIFVLAFLEPAVRVQETTVLSGWKCATIATTESMTLFGKPGAGKHQFIEYLVAISGWINPLIVLVILASPIRALRILRQIFAVLVVLCMAATWVLFSKQHIVPLMGHFLWIAGALLILIPETLPGRRAVGAVNA
ncbi:MAG TPA: hypothetical protein VME23_18025 [Terracidiphilus sp.]|nr:hypothetical protein [Terracidiphilus sp.]